MMCLGFVVLGVTALRGQDEAEKAKEVEVIIVEQQEKTAENPAAVLEAVRDDDLKRVEIQLRNDATGIVGDDGDSKNIEVRKEGGEVIILNKDDGKIVRKYVVNAQEKGPTAARFLRMTDGPAIDPATREVLEKLMGGLKEEAGRLSNEGKKEEAERKLQSLRAIESLLNPGAQWKVFAQPGPGTGLIGKRALRIEAGPAADEMKKLHARMEELHAQFSKLPEGDKEGRIKMEHAMRELKTQIGELQRQTVQAVPYPPGAPVLAPGLVPGQPVPAGAGARFNVQFGGPSPEADALARKAAALHHAAAQLSQAGLEDQAGELRKQAEKLRAESEKLRAQTAHAPVMAGFAGAGPVELHRSIHELQEQVQQLRKEVAELRELLQKRQ
jgi:hypothetical protein